MEEWGTSITTITTIPPFPTTKGKLWGSGGFRRVEAVSKSGLIRIELQAVGFRGVKVSGFGSFRQPPRRLLKLRVWGFCLVLSREWGNGLWGLYRDYYRDPFPTKNQTAFGTDVRLPEVS